PRRAVSHRMWTATSRWWAATVVLVLAAALTTCAREGDGPGQQAGDGGGFSGDATSGHAPDDDGSEPDEQEELELEPVEQRRDDEAVVPDVPPPEWVSWSDGDDAEAAEDRRADDDGEEAGEEAGEERFTWEVSRVSEATREAMDGVTWQPDCPVGLDELREVELTHHGFDGGVHRGELIVHTSVVDDLEQVFAAAFGAGFPFEEVVAAHRYDGDDDAIMAANASSAFNCRPITGGDGWSQHSYGTAVDLNPVLNPYARDGTVLPSAGSDHLDRTDPEPGMLVEGDPVIDAADRLGWEWGGRWQGLVDHMHLERP
ncbi:MAG: M15 family metallopeptidase, partial [Nitriliruptoraceae bacterium]